MAAPRADVPLTRPSVKESHCQRFSAEVPGRARDLRKQVVGSMEEKQISRESIVIGSETRRRNGATKISSNRSCRKERRDARAVELWSASREHSWTPVETWVQR